MIHNYTALLSMGKAQVLQIDGGYIECDMVYGDHITLAIKGRMHDFVYWRVSLDGDTWKWQLSVDNGDGLGHRHAIRLLINRFLQVVPSSDPTVRMWNLLNFLSKPSSLHNAGSIKAAISKRISNLKRTAFGRPALDAYKTIYFVRRKDKYSDRQRDYLRLQSPRNARLNILANQIVGAYSAYCSNFNHGSSDDMSMYGRGWILSFSDMRIVGYSENGLKKKMIELAPLNTNSESLVALYGIRNVFCADIVEQTEDTALLKVYGKNSKPKGYVCVDKKDKHITFIDRSVRLSSQRYTADDIGNTRGEAIARMLAKR